MRYGEREDLWAAMIWLLSDASRFVTGIVVPVDGGFSASSIQEELRDFFGQSRARSRSAVPAITRTAAAVSLAYWLTDSLSYIDRSRAST